MSRRAQASEGDGRKALDLWYAPAGAGEPCVCIASTFTFDAGFFEEECLGRFLQMETRLEENLAAAYLVEREEKLVATRCCVLVDRRHATSRESLRWDILPVTVRGGVQHAKMTLLCWTNAVRVIIGSGNLTEPGYRKNLEVFGTLQASREEGGHVEQIRECLDLFSTMIDAAPGELDRPGPKSRVRDALTQVRQRIRRWPQQKSQDLRVFPIFVGTSRSVPQKLAEILPSGSPPRYAHILSPFFDRGNDASELLDELLKLLAKRGDREVLLYVTGEKLDDGRVRVHVPEELVRALQTRIDTRLLRVEPEQDGELRYIHAKMLVLQSENWETTLIGSSNFTSAGFGIHSKTANFEANLVYVAHPDKGEGKTISKVWPKTDQTELDIDSKKLIFDPLVDHDVGTGTWLPLGFVEALYLAEAAAPRLIFRVLPASLHESA